MIYTFIFVFYIVTIFSITTKRNSGIIRKGMSELIFATVFLSIIILAFLVGINTKRADYENYLKAFQDMPVLGTRGFFDYALSQHTEIGYNIFSSLIKTFGGSATLFFIIFCLTSLIFRYLFSNAFVSKSDLGLIFAAFFSHEFLRKDCVQIRNGFASALVLYALIALYKGYRWRFLFIVFLASCFHSVAVIAMPLFFVKKKTSNKYEKLLIFLFLFSFFISIVLPIRQILSSLAALHLVPAQIVTYLNWSTYLTPMSFINPQLIKQIVITGWILWNHKRLFYDKRIFFLSQVYLLSTVYYLLFRDFEILAARFGSLFYAVEVPLLVVIIEKSNKYIYLKKIGICIFYFALFVLNYLTYQVFLGWKPAFN